MTYPLHSHEPFSPLQVVQVVWELSAASLQRSAGAHGASVVVASVVVASVVPRLVRVVFVRVVVVRLGFLVRSVRVVFVRVVVVRLVRLVRVVVARVFVVVVEDVVGAAVVVVVAGGAGGDGVAAHLGQSCSVRPRVLEKPTTLTDPNLSPTSSGTEHDVWSWMVDSSIPPALVTVTYVSVGRFDSSIVPPIMTAAADMTAAPFLSARTMVTPCAPSGPAPATLAREPCVLQAPVAQS